MLIATQTISGVSATTSAIIASIPSATATATVTLTPTHTRRPTATPTPSQPAMDPLAGVTLICNDGTYSYSQSQRGTCSRRGGVKEWIHKPPNWERAGIRQPFPNYFTVPGPPE